MEKSLCALIIAIQTHTMAHGQIRPHIASQHIGCRSPNHRTGNEAQTVAKWRDIATAPKDGSQILLLVQGSGAVYAAFWGGVPRKPNHVPAPFHYWCEVGDIFACGDPPTHWTNIPEHSKS